MLPACRRRWYGIKSTVCDPVKQRLNNQYNCLQYLTRCVRFLVGAGGTASGKSTVCDLVKQRLNDQCVVMLSQDSFYRGLTQQELENVSGMNYL